jgi:hypothetical protein
MNIKESKLFQIFCTPPYKWTKLLSLEMIISSLKMMTKSGLEFFILKLNEPLQSCCCPERLNWPVRLAGISEGAHSISKKKEDLDHFSSSFLSQKWSFQELRV